MKWPILRLPPTPAAPTATEPTLAQQNPVPEAASVAATPVAKEAPAESKEIEKQVAQKPAYVAGPKRTGIGKFLSEDEW